MESQISSIDEEKLPQIFSEQIECLKTANEEYKNAAKKESEAKENVTKALNRAKDLIKEAEKVGGNDATKKHFIIWRQVSLF